MKIGIIDSELGRLHQQIKETTTDAYQFEKNVRCESKYSELIRVRKLIQEHEDYIAKIVYKYERSFRYTNNRKEQDVLNTLGKKKILFTRELFDEFCDKYIKYQIEYLTRQLIEQKITSNSTNKLLNLKFEWELETKQELIKFYKNLIR